MLALCLYTTLTVTTAGAAGAAGVNCELTTAARQQWQEVRWNACVCVGSGGARIRRGLQPYGLSQPFTVFGSLAPNQIGIYLHATSLFSNMVDVGWGRDDILRRPSAHSPFTLHASAIEPTPYSNCTAYYWKIELHFTCRARNYHIFMHHTELLPGCISIDFANAMIVAIQCIPCNMHGLLLFHG